jgi:succinate dehydrogenase / fumarate reductase flavoprotein subunit
MQREAKSPPGPLEAKWDGHRFDLRLLSPANKRKFNIMVAGTGLGAIPGFQCLPSTGPRGMVIK